MRIFWFLFSKFVLLLLSLRYRIRVKGLDQLNREFSKKGGILFLPNHPAHMDALILFFLLWPKYRMRPLVIEYIFRLSFMKPLMRLIRAIPLPNFDTSINQLKVKKAQESIQKIADGLKDGENFVLYPAGRLKNSGREILGGASGAHAIIKECLDAQIVLIRTTGLWGSSFSRALLGRSPDLSKTLFHGLKVILKNAIFFCPRRNVQIEIEINPKELTDRKFSRIEFNRYLENWYNRYPCEGEKICDEEPLTLVSYAFWKQDFPEVFQQKKISRVGGGVEIQPETQSKVYDEIRRILDNPNLEITPEKGLALDLGMDSLNIAELITFLSRTYDIEEVHPEDLETVQSILEITEGSRISEHPVKETGVFRWPKEENRLPPDIPVGRILPEALLNSCERMGSHLACADDLVGVLSYKQLRRAVLVLASYFQKLPDTHIAILLPASVGVYLLSLALQFAKKVPVMLNWTLGPRYLDDMMKLSGAKMTISSWRFLDRLSHVEFGSSLDNLRLLEDIRTNLDLKTKLRGAFLSLRSKKSILRILKLNQVDENDPCVILFTSGTEASPKGVPLSHKNILSNLRSGMQCISFIPDDTMYGCLPPFHSFGFSVAGLFPLLSGIRIAFYPDPTDNFALAEGVERWKITLFCSPPSFLKGLFHAAKKGQLDSIRMFISGAEKAPPELLERIEKMGTGAKLVEGYGITECSPMIAMNRSNLPATGVGRPLPGIELCTIHPETLELLPEGSEGEICVFGENVFNGYLGNPRPAYIEINKKRWYRTGDLGYINSEGNLILSGRLKRFTKIGGEMISLGAIEQVITEELLKQGRISSDIPTLAVCADEKVSGKPQLILFATVAIDKEEANEILKNSGISRLIKIFAVHKVEEIPLLGTGKTNYRHLQSLV